MAANPEHWQEINREFKALSAKEAQKDPENRNDSWLSAYIGRKGESDWPFTPDPLTKPSLDVIHVGTESESELMPVSVLTETPRPLLCLSMARQVRAPQDSGGSSGDLGAFLSDGIGDLFKADFEVLATRAGKKLEPANTRITPLQNWLLALLVHLLESKSDLLYRDDRQTGGIILRVCEASSLFAARLEREALERNAEAVSGDELPNNQPTQPKRKKGRPRRALSAVRQAIIQRVLAATPAAKGREYCALLDAEFKSSHQPKTTPMDWRGRGCPDTYTEAYNFRDSNGKHLWKQPIWGEKAKNTR